MWLTPDGTNAVDILALPVRRSWSSAFGLAAAIELGLIAFVALIIFSPSGPDNPLPWVLAWLLQLPSSLLVMWLLDVIPAERNFTLQALSLYAAVMFVGQTLLLGVWLRKPWRRVPKVTRPQPTPQRGRQGAA
jgi:hypothetical protein